MRTLTFQVKKFRAEEFSRRPRQHDQFLDRATAFLKSLSTVTRAVAIAVCVLLGFAAMQWTYEIANGENAPAVRVSGHLLSGRNVLILHDISGSMKGTGDRMKALSEELKRGGINANRIEAVLGFGFWEGGDPTNSLNVLERELAEDSLIDSIFIFSDFRYVDKEIDFSDTAGYLRLRNILSSKRRRLYLGTVNVQPPAELIKIAADSGGDLLKLESPATPDR